MTNQETCIFSTADLERDIRREYKVTKGRNKYLSWQGRKKQATLKERQRLKAEVEKSFGNLDFTIVKAGDLPKDMEVTAISDVIREIDTEKKRLGIK